MQEAVSNQGPVEVFKRRKGLIAPDLRGSDFRSIFSLLTENDQENFFQTYWEKKPVHFDNHGKADNLVNKKVFSKAKLLEILDSHDLPLETTLSALQYKDYVRKSWPFESEVANSREVSEAFSQLQTVQFFQPQRFSDELYRISAGFEHVFGSLAGASAYLTPAHSQGLAPHHDDVDVFVLQCEGMKAWNLWENNLSLPENHSSDFARASLPASSTHILLRAGDMLYLPRGTIHEAIAQSSFSTHITISVYQRYNMKKLLLQLTPKLLDSAFTKNYELRKGLPLWLSDRLGSLVGLEESHDQSQSTEGNRSQPTTPRLQGGTDRTQWRYALVDEVKRLMQSLCDEVCLNLLDEAADEITGDFVMHRLPPPDLPSIDNESDEFTLNAEHKRIEQTCQNISAQSVVRMCDPASMFCMVKEEDGVSMLALAHNKNNSRATHMGHPDHRDFGLSEEVGDKDENEDENEVGDDKDEDKEEDHDDGDEDGDDDNNGGDYDNPEGFSWTLYLPIRVAPIIFALRNLSQGPKGEKKESFCFTGATVKSLQDAVKSDRIFPDEVLDTVLELFQAGFVDLQNPTKKGKNNNEGTAVSGKEQKAATLHTSKSRGEADVNLRSVPSSNVKKKRKRSLRDVSLSVPVLDAVSREPSQTGYIVGGSNRFYETENKPKRKKLRL